MLISIQPLDHRGQPTDKSFTSDWAAFLDLNDGFDGAEIARMESALKMGSGYIIGGGAAGAFRLKKTETKEDV